MTPRICFATSVEWGREVEGAAISWYSWRGRLRYAVIKTQENLERLVLEIQRPKLLIVCGGKARLAISLISERLEETSVFYVSHLGSRGLNSKYLSKTFDGMSTEQRLEKIADWIAKSFADVKSARFPDL